MVRFLQHSPRLCRPTAESAALNPAKCRFESYQRHHARLAQLAEAIVSKAIQSQFESESEHHFLDLPMDGRRTSNLANEVRLLIGLPWKVN